MKVKQLAQGNKIDNVAFLRQKNEQKLDNANKMLKKNNDLLKLELNKAEEEVRNLNKQLSEF